MPSFAAFTTVTPAVDELNVTTQLPVVPTVRQLATDKLPGPLKIGRASCRERVEISEAEPSFKYKCAVNVCGEPTSFVADNGEIWIFASTNVFVAFVQAQAGA